VTDWLREGIADIAVQAATNWINGVPLAEDRMIAVLDHDHVLATQASVSLADLSDDPFILSDGGCEPLLRQMYKAAGLGLRPKLPVRDMATLLALVREQVGVTVIPELSFTDPRGLVAVPVKPVTHRRLVLTTHSQDVGPAAHAFLDLPTSGDLQSFWWGAVFLMAVPIMVLLLGERAKPAARVPRVGAWPD
jgi:DNA-binding transcriptional LysR family regulator